MQVPKAPRYELKVDLESEIVPADAPRLPIGRSGDLGASPFFAANRQVADLSAIAYVAPQMQSTIGAGKLRVGAFAPQSRVFALLNRGHLRRQVRHPNRKWASRRTFLCRCWVRRHRSEIMFGVLVVILRPDKIAG